MAERMNQSDNSIGVEFLLTIHAADVVRKLLFTHHHNTKSRQRQKVLLNPFSPEFGAFSLEKLGEFSLNPRSLAKFTNLLDFAFAMVGPLLSLF